MPLSAQQVQSIIQSLRDNGNNDQQIAEFLDDRIKLFKDDPTNPAGIDTDTITTPIDAPGPTLAADAPETPLTTEQRLKLTSKERRAQENRLSEILIKDVEDGIIVNLRKLLEEANALYTEAFGTPQMPGGTQLSFETEVENFNAWFNQVRDRMRDQDVIFRVPRQPKIKALKPFPFDQTDDDVDQPDAKPGDQAGDPTKSGGPTNFTSRAQIRARFLVDNNFNQGDAERAINKLEGENYYADNHLGNTYARLQEEKSRRMERERIAREEPPVQPTVPGLPDGSIIGPGGLLGRQQLIEEQQDPALFLRGLQEATGRGFGEFIPIAQRAIDRAFSRFQDVSPITNYFPQQERGASWRDYLTGPQPTAASLQTSLGNILGDFANRPSNISPAYAKFSTTFGTPQAALSAAAQPYLTNIAPRLRGAAQKGIFNMFGPQFATDPQQYQTPEQIFGVFKDFQSRGF